MEINNDLTESKAGGEIQ